MWVQHMLATLNNRGRMGVVLDNGALFRGGEEGKIRKAIVEDDLIEGIVALPPNLFYNTGAPGCLIIINKHKPDNLKNKIFFIHAENECEEGKAQNFLRDTHIQKISETYRKIEVEQKFSDIIDIDEIRENDFNLNVSRYIDILPEEELVDVTESLSQLKKLKDERWKLEKEFERNMRELGYE
jgi:type I restriction enzyme M protein